MAKLWPLSSSISVCTRRVESAGMVKPWKVRPLAKSSELTSGVTCRRMVPRGVMLGVNVDAHAEFAERDGDRTQAAPAALQRGVGKLAARPGSWPACR